MIIFDLAGKWKLKQAGAKRSITAAVPGCVHTDLLRAGKIEDPYYRDNEKGLQWIGEAGWIYWREFQISSELLNSDRVLLCCEGLDTLATISVNGKKIAKTDNMFRRWEFDVKRLLKQGTNSTSISGKKNIQYRRGLCRRFRTITVSGYARSPVITGGTGGRSL